MALHSLGQSRLKATNCLTIALLSIKTAAEGKSREFNCGVAQIMSTRYYLGNWGAPDQDTGNMQVTLRTEFTKI